MADRHVEFALIGGGLASGNCARWLREEGANGSILLIGREPDIPYPRTLHNSEAIRDERAGKRLVLMGGSYIASEVAASLTERGSSCALVKLEPGVLSRTFGEQAGRFFQTRLEEHGIQVHGDDV